MKEISNIKLPSLDETNKNEVIIRKNFNQIEIDGELQWECDVEFVTREEYYKRRLEFAEQRLDVLEQMELERILGGGFEW